MRRWWGSLVLSCCTVTAGAGPGPVEGAAQAQAQTQVQAQAQAQAQVQGSQQEAPSVLAWVNKTAFFFGLPGGWRVDLPVAQQMGAISVLYPSGHSFSSAPHVIVVAAYLDAKVDAAMAEDLARFSADDPTLVHEDLAPLVTALDLRCPVRMFRTTRYPEQALERVVYVPYREMVVTFSYSAQTEAQFRAGIPAFEGMVRAFAPADLEVRQE